jgi:hypothetical protein
MEQANRVFDQPRVKIVAIAKDEAAYIPEWVHHHLYFGFDAIEIHINRTTDNSADILDEICKQYPNVSWDYADWVDMCPGEAATQIQFVVYAKALFEARKSGEFSHILFLDIDEFWCPQDYSMSIQDYIGLLPGSSAIFFEWLNDLGDLPTFSPVPQNIEGNLSPLGKTLLPVDVVIKELRHHVPLLTGNARHVLADGTTFKPRERQVQALDAEFSFLKQAFIYHRANRSVIEYVSLLFRGRPGNDFNYKNNRTGLPGPRKRNCGVDFPSQAYEKLQVSYQQFKAKRVSQYQLQRAQEFVISRYNLSIENIGSALVSHYRDMLKIFFGVKVPEVVAHFAKFREIKIAQQPENVALIRDLAIDAAKQDIEEAIRLMTQAQKLRPKGPQIRQRLAAFEQKRLRLLEKDKENRQ